MPAATVNFLISVCSMQVTESGSVRVDLVGGTANDGLVYAHHRTITEFTTDGTSSTYTAPDTFGSAHRVVLDDVELVEASDYYIVAPSSVQFNPYVIRVAGQILRIRTGKTPDPGQQPVWQTSWAAGCRLRHGAVVPPAQRWR